MSAQRVYFKSPLLPYLLVLPQMAIIGVFFFWPAFQAILQSFFVQDSFGLSSRFVGLSNYFALFDDGVYLESLGTTFLFSFSVTALALSSGMVLAYMTNNLIVGANTYKAVIILPYAIAPLVAGAIFFFMFNPTVGIISFHLYNAGIDWDHTLNTLQAFLLVVVAASWKQISYNFLFFLAGLQNIPESIVEASVIDGASPIRRFWRIIFPLLSPTTFFLLVMNVVYSFFETFGVIQQLTEGGPGRATNILVYKVYRDGFLGLDWGTSSAQSVMLMIIVITLTLLKFKFLEKKVVY